MPILSYFAVVGSVMVALLFAADAMLPKHGPVVVSSEFYGMPKPWRPDPTTQILAARPAPAPDMTSEAVQAAAPKSPAHDHMAKGDLPKAKPDAAPKKKTVRRQADGGRQDYAWSRNGREGFFGGGSAFGRF